MPSITSSSGRTYHLGRIRRPDRPERWLRELRVPAHAPTPGVRSLSQYRTAQPLDQAAEGSCTANAGVLVQYMCDRIMGVAVPTLLSRMHEYYLERHLADNETFPTDSGASIEDAYSAPIQNGGLVAESVWPYDAQPAEQPPAAVASAPKANFIADGQPIAPQNLVAGIRTAIDNLQPTTIGFDVSQAMIDGMEATGVMTLAQAVNFEGGHDITAIGECAPSAKDGLPTGGFVFQNSWGFQDFPTRTDLWPDWHAGDVALPFELFDGKIVQDADAAVPMTKPAILSLALTGPATLAVGASGAFAATVTGAPTGTQLTYAWTFGDTANGSGQTASHAYATAGNYVIGCTATNAKTGASASATMTVSVTPAPTPGPQPGPAPTPPPSVQPAIDAQMASTIATLKADAQSQPAVAGFYSYAATVMAWEQGQIDALFAGTASAAPRPTPEAGA